MIGKFIENPIVYFIEDNTDKFIENLIDQLLEIWVDNSIEYLMYFWLKSNLETWSDITLNVLLNIIVYFLYMVLILFYIWDKQKGNKI